jgi:hypothetical protein
MNYSRILINGVIVYIIIAIFFVIMELLNLSDQIYLRLINFIPVIWGINRTIKANVKDHVDGYFTNLVSGILTGVTALALVLISFIIYVEIRGEHAYLRRFADSYIFGGGDPSVYQFAIGLALEGIASSVIVSFALMQYWKDKVEKINKVDDTVHTTSTRDNNY